MKFPKYTDIYAQGESDTQYRKVTSDYVSTITVDGQEILKVEPEGLRLLTVEAMRDISHLLRTSHYEKLAKILDDPEASDNDRFVARELFKNANIAAGMVLPSCQDTGTGIVMGKKGQFVWTDGNDNVIINQGVIDTFTQNNLRYSQLAPKSLFEETNTKTNGPAQVDIYATEGKEYHFLFIAKGGGSANKTFLYQQNPAILREDKLSEFLDEKIRTLGTSACPPYHLAVVIGGLSAEQNLKTVKMASTHYLDNLPTEGSDFGQAIRCPEMEEKILKMTQSFDIGAQFGG